MENLSLSSSSAPSRDAKLVILGASGVGKTCIGLRFVKDTFVSYSATTIGAAFLVKEIAVPPSHQRITLQIWDTAGQERFRSMAPLYYRGAVAAILVFSLVDAASFDKLKAWVRELTANIEESLVLAIAANKCDAPVEQRTVSYADAERYAASIGAVILQTSAKEDVGIRDLFNEVGRRLLQTRFREGDSSSLQLPSLPDALQERRSCSC